jgi:hypothetical protein
MDETTATSAESEITCWPSDAQPKLAKALTSALRDVHGVHKGSEGEAGQGRRYAYASAEAVITEALRVLSKHALIFTLQSYRLGPEREFEVKVGGGKDAKRVRVSPPTLEATYRLEHESGEWRTIRSDGTAIMCDGGRPPDKAMATAKTYDLSYALRTLLMLPRVEDEPDRRDDTEWAEGHRVRASKPAFDWPADINEAIARRADADDRAEAWNQLCAMREAHGLPRRPAGTDEDPLPRRLNEINTAIETLIAEHNDEENG